MSGQAAAIWCLDGGWCVWLLVWVALSRRVKRVARRESPVLRLAHLVPMTIAGGLMLFSTPDGGTWLERRLLPRAGWMAYAGCALVLAGLAFAIWARLVLAGNWSGTVTLKQDHELVATGPYAWARHPIYTGLLAAMLGTAIAIDQVRGVMALVIMTVAFLRKMRTEEEFMRQAFAERYREYQRRVAALIPGIW